MKKPSQTRTVYLVEWKNEKNIWKNKKFHVFQEAISFSNFIESARTVLVRETQENI